MEVSGIKVHGLPTKQEDKVEESDAKGDRLPQLPNDLITEILARMQVMSVLRFKCVSKSWNSLIKETAFIDKHAFERKKNGNKVLMRRCYKQNKYNMLSFHDLDSSELGEVQLPNLSIPEWDSSCNHPRLLGEDYILGPCKGLVCIMECDICNREPYPRVKCAERIILCNPALREFKLLPPCPFETVHNWEDYVSGRGLGISCTNEFKVVLVRCLFYLIPRRYDESDSESEDEGDSVRLPPYVVVHLYNSGTNSWRQIDYHGTVHPHGYESSYVGLFFNGACHWHAATGFNATSLYDMSPFVVLSFDMNNEVFKQLEYPVCVMNMDTQWRQLVVLHECLALIQPQHSCQEIDSQRIEVWVMMEYGVKSSWVKQFVVRSEEVLIFPRSRKCGSWKPRLGHLDRRMACIELINKENNKVCVYWNGRHARAVLYEESLLSLKQVIMYS